MLISRKLVWLLPLLSLATNVSSQEFLFPEIDDIASETNVSLVDAEIVVTTTTTTTNITTELATNVSSQEFVLPEIDDIASETNVSLADELESEIVVNTTTNMTNMSMSDKIESEIVINTTTNPTGFEEELVTVATTELTEEDDGADVLEEQFEIVIALVDFTLVLGENSSINSDDLGLSDYLYDKMKSITPDLESVKLETKDYKEEGTFEVTYEGFATWRSDKHHPSVIAAPFNTLLGIDDPESYNFTSSFINANVSLEVEHYHLTLSMFHDMQIAILKDLQSIQDYWEYHGEAIGENLRIESLEVESSILTDTESEPVESEPIESEPVEEVPTIVVVAEEEEVVQADGDVPEEEEEEEEKETKNVVSMRLLDFKILLHRNEDSEQYIADLGLSNYLYDKMKIISPDLVSVELELVNYTIGSADFTYEGRANWSSIEEHSPSVIAAPYNALLDIDDPESNKFTSFTDTYNVLEVEHYKLTESMFHEMQIMILQDFQSIQDHWETYEETIGKNLYIESLEVGSSAFPSTNENDMSILFDDTTAGLDKWVIPVIISAAVTVCALILWFMPKGGL